MDGEPQPRALPTLFLASPVLGTQASESARRLIALRKLVSSTIATSSVCGEFVASASLTTFGPTRLILFKLLKFHDFP